MKKVYFSFVFVTFFLGAMFAQGQQLPNSNFNDWSGEKFDGKEQPASWHYSNVTQVGMKFNFAKKETGRSGQSGDYSMKVEDMELGAIGITETSPGYIALGQPWAYLEGINVGSATAGTYGGINWKSRPDTLSVWVKRTGSHWKDEDFHVLFYAWKGTAKGNSYKNKNNGCTDIERTDEESDVRQALDANECGTAVKATQICEGWVYGRKEYSNWVNLRIPIYYLNNEIPEKMNVIFSASNYPNFRANSGLYTGNSLYVDDAELVYSAKIDQLIVGDKVWTDFNPNSSEEQVYELSKSVTAIPPIVAKRGIGSLTNSKGVTVNFPGRELNGSELTITNGVIGEVTTLTVKSEDGKSTMVYKIRFQYPASNNANLSNIEVNGQAIPNFKSNIYEYYYALPFGTTESPVITCTPADAKQKVDIVQATSVTGTATITVTAADNKTKNTYTIHFSVDQLSDNTLQNILVNGKSVPGFSPSKTSYRVSLPVDTKQMPTVKAVSAYKDGAQTITYKAPNKIDGGTYEISVTTPGNTTPKVYKLTFKLEPSSYAYLADLKMGTDVNYITDFEPEKLNYTVSLPLGTLTVPTITPVPGDEYQNVEVLYGELNGISRVTVTAGDGVTSNVYKITVSTVTSSVTTLKAIYVDGVLLPDFNPDKLTYDYDLPLGTTSVPEVTVENGDPYQVVTITYGGLNGITRILVTAGDGSTRLYQIQFHQQVSSINTLKDIQVDGVSLLGFDPQVTEYTYLLPLGTTVLPTVTYTVGDEYQTVTTRSGGVGGDYKIIVYPQQGASRTYIIHFKVATSSNTKLAMIYLDGQPLANFNADILEYSVTLPQGVSIIPTVTVDKAESEQRVLTLVQGEQVLITVTAQNGDKATYTLTFVLQVSDNAFLKAILLDGDTIPQFAPDKMHYDVTYTDHRPAVSVEPNDGQQITIVLPQESGDAQIYVQSQAGGINIYTITFIKQVDDDAVLTNVLVDGQPIADFQPRVFDYTVHYEGSLPTITWEAAEDVVVTPYWQAQKLILRVASAAASRIYTITLERDLSDDCELSGILLDEVTFSSFEPTTHAYTVGLEAGSALPRVTFMPKNDRQQLTSGVTDQNTFAVVVTAENGAQATYSVTFNVALYDLTAPLSIAVDGLTLAYNPAQLVYNLTIGNGEELPRVTVIPDKGQSVIVYDESNVLQKVLVTAQNGAQAVYEIHYTRQKSNNALLADILINNQSIDGFRSDSFNYVDTLAWRTKFVPCVLAKGTMTTQTITTHYCAVDGVMTIDVLAEDEETLQTYTIDFPVIKSSNTNLESVAFTDLNDWEFSPAITDYAFTLPYGTTAVPQLELYEKQEPEQQVAIESRPLGDTTFIEVTAENGDVKRYSFLFKAKEAEAANHLRTLQYRYARENTPEQFDTISLNVTQFEHIVNLPYGTKTFEVIYTKNYNEQVIFAQAGGTLRPTIIKVQANHTDYEDLTYAITPKVSTQNPAVLTGITVDGTPIESFEPNTLTYVINRTSINMPNVVYTHASNVICEPTTDIHMWKCVVTSDSYNNQYTIYFHYPNDIIPNGEFTDWTNAATRTSAKKPTGWQVAADYADTYLGTAKTGEEISQSGDAVKFTTTYWAALKSAIPSIITLGKLNFSFAVDKATSSQFYDQIPFRNSPDSVIFRYYLKEKGSEGEGALFAFRFFDNASQEYKFDYHNTQTSSNYQEIHHPLNTNGIAVQGMNIAVNATNQTTYASPQHLWSSGAEMYLDYIRFSYNSQLAALQVNGLDATLTNKAFTVTLTDCEQTAIPSLAFTGQVSDQAQQITWQAEDAEGKRKAKIRNFAEDGTYTDYTLTVTRPLQSSADLQSLLVNGEEISGFDASTTAYTYTMTSAQLPDVDYKAQSNLQTITMNYADSVMTIAVTAENGTNKNYTIRMKHPLSNNTALTLIDGLEGFDSDTHSYTIESDQLPDMNFYKGDDAQTVVMRNGIFTVKAEDGSVGTYTIIAQPQPRLSQGVILEFELDGFIPADFGGTNYDKTTQLPQWVSFTCEDYRDSVVVIQTENYIQWQVFGTQANTTYTLTQPTQDDTNTKLSAILVADTLLADFNPDIKEYTIITDSAVALRAIPVYEKQKVEITLTDNVYSILVTALNGTSTATYTVTIQPDLSNQANLEMIYVGGQEIANFRSDSTDYVVVLPSPQVKQQESVMPTITYRTCSNATISVEAGKLGEPTLLTVTSEDQTAHRYYSVLVEAEPSHNADLTAILIDNQPVEHFASTYAYYSTTVKSDDFTVSWAAEDKFLTVDTQILPSNDNHVLVTLDTKAQDDTTTRHYEVNVYVETFMANATLADITLNGQAMSQFLSELNPMLAFSPMNNQYTINLPTGTAILPNVEAVLGQEGQKVTYVRDGLQVQLQVASKDNAATNTYTLQFVVPKSSNTKLSAIFVNGEAIEGFEPTTLVYSYTLPLDLKEQQIEVIGQQSDATQIVADAVFEGNRATIEVTAEDQSKAHYVVVFEYIAATADTLLAIYEDAQLLPGFAPTINEYSLTLPSTDRRFPNLDWELGDEHQTVVMDTIVEDEYHLYRNITVTAQDGRQRVYSVHYEITKSCVDTLAGIFINDKPLESFIGSQTEYSVYVNEGDEQPIVSWLMGDEYQQVSVTTLPEVGGVKAMNKAVILVEAEDGSINIYTIHFLYNLDGNTQLKMIRCNGHDLEGFDPERLSYIVVLAKNEDYPFIGWEQNNDMQRVIETRVEDTTSLCVTAENGNQLTYKIVYKHNLSENAQLSDILFNETSMPTFNPEVFEYQFVVEYGDLMPTVTPVAAEPVQTITLHSDTTQNAQGSMVLTITIEVLAEETSVANEYFLSFTFMRNDDATLKAVLVQGKALEDFDPFVTDYVLYLPVGSDSSAFYKVEDITYQLSDSLATTTISQQMDGMIIIMVTAADGETQQAYTIKQEVKLDDNNYLSAILLDSIEIPGFSPDIEFYTYVLSDGSSIPSIEALAESERALVNINIKSVGDTSVILCEAENKEVRKYYVYFALSSINDVQQPTSHDVVLKFIEGTTDIVVATTRRNVTFCLFDAYGKRQCLYKLNPANYNYTDIHKDKDGVETFFDFDANVVGQTIHLIPNQFYIYAFMEGEKRIIQTGKLMAH